jgi:hypothetical protein
MRRLIGLIIFLLIFSFPLRAMAGFWGFEKEFAKRENVPYSEITQKIYGYVDRVASSPNSQVPLELKQVFQAIFEPKAVKIPFRIATVKGTSRKVTAAGTIYFARGDIFVIYDRVSGDSSGSFNYATVGGKLYSWRIGEKNGEILKRFPGDTIELVDYLIDPSMIMRYNYFEYYRKPENFSVTKEQNSVTIMHKQNPYGFAGIKFSKSPLWLQTGIFAPCNSSKCPPVTQKTELTLWEVDRPVSLEQIPAKIKSLPKTVKFQKSDQTVDSRLVYL